MSTPALEHAEAFKSENPLFQNRRRTTNFFLKGYCVMLNKVNPIKTKSWKKLTDHFEEMKDIHMKSLFSEDPQRFEKFSIRFNDILVDYSKNRITKQTLKLLVGLAVEVGLGDAIEKMFQGDKINETENRAVLHVALRNRRNAPVLRSYFPC